MEQTLGKRIAENRKKMKMTQDQLAEHLGLTAQAVSKWENDQSCPDITTLPKLAEIFGITTDELLGCDPREKIHEGEVVEDSDSGIHLQWDSEQKEGNGWEFHWDSGKKDALTFAILVLLTGGLTLCSRLLEWDVSFWSILWPSVLLVYGVRWMLPRFSVFSLGMTLIGAYYLLENLGICELDLAGELIFPIVVVLFGLGLLIDALKKPKKPVFRITRKGESTGRKTKCDCSNSADSFECNLSFGEKVHCVDLPCLTGGDATVSFGELTVDLSGCETVSDGCGIRANCSFGELILLVPRRFCVKPKSNAAFAAVNISGHPDSEPAGIIYLEANASFGEIAVHYI